MKLNITRSHIINNLLPLQVFTKLNPNYLQLNIVINLYLNKIVSNKNLYMYQKDQIFLLMKIMKMNIKTTLKYTINK